MLAAHFRPAASGRSRRFALAVRPFRAATGLAAFLFAFAPAANAQTYTVLDLGTLGGSQAHANALNNSGTVVGDSFLAGDAATHAFAYYDGVIHDLGTLGGTTSSARAINRIGTIVGTAARDSGAARAFSYVGNTMTDLGTSGVANSINDSGTIVGNMTGSFPPSGGFYSQPGFVYSGGSVTPFNGPTCVLNGINNSGTFVGAKNNYGENVLNPYAFTLNSEQRLSDYSVYSAIANAINDSGIVVGTTYSDFFGPSIAFAYYGGALHKLPTLGGQNSFAYAVNNSGVIVGSSLNAGGAQRAYFYTNGTMKDLNTLLPGGSGWNLQQANGINDAGWVCGYGIHNGATHAFLLKPYAAVSGRLALEGVSNLAAVNPAVPASVITFEFRVPGTTNAVYSTTTTLAPVGGGSAFGAYSIPAALSGVYDVAVKGGRQLRVVIPNVTVNGATNLPDTTLPAGDANNDNIVDIADFGVLVNAYGGSAANANSGYNAAADFNYDGLVDVADFGLLVNAYGNTGSP